MKYLFLKPISYLDYIILPGIPSLIGILENAGIEARYISLEAEYFKSLQKEDFVNYNKLLGNFYKNKDYLTYPECFKEKLSKNKEFFYKQLLWLSKNIKNYDLYHNLFVNKKILQNPFLYVYLMNFFTDFESINPLISCSEGLTDVNIEDLLFLFDSPINNFKDFYEKKADELIKEKPDIVGIQITLTSDLISSLMLGYIIKKKNKKIHINIGGNYFEEYNKKIKNLKNLFGIFFDSISIGDSTGSVLELTKYVNNEISIEEVPGLLYLKNGNLKSNPQKKFSNLNALPFQSFTGYRKDNYFMPEFILPVRSSTTYSCYWGKCIYCACSGKKEPYRIMSAERFVDEIEYLSKKYNTKYFIFWDNALHPKYLDKVSDILLKKRLNIKYTLYARLEEGFSEHLLKKIKKSGCIAIHWGFDNASERLLNYINKGTKISVAKKVLEYSKKSGIYNFIYIMTELPTQTIEDLDVNFDFVKENRKNIDEVHLLRKLLFLDGSVITNNYEYYNEKINRTSEFEEKKQDIINEVNKIKKTSIIQAQFVYFYIDKYGLIIYNIINEILYYYSNNKNTLLKKILNLYFKFLIYKESLLLKLKNSIFKYGSK